MRSLSRITPTPIPVPIARRRPALSEGGLFDIKPQINAPVSISLGLGSLPLSIGLFAASGASFLVGSQVPNVKGITDILGIAAAGLGVANIIAGELKKPEGPPPPPETRALGPDSPPRFSQELQIPVAAPGILAENLSVQVDPFQGATGGGTRNNWQAQEFEFTVRNNEPVTRAFCLGLAIYDSDQSLVYKTPVGPSRKCFSVGAFGVITEKLTAPAFKFWTPRVVTVAVDVFRSMNDQAPIMTSEPIGIKVGYVG